MTPAETRTRRALAYSLEHIRLRLPEPPNSPKPRDPGDWVWKHDDFTLRIDRSDFSLCFHTEAHSRRTVGVMRWWDADGGLTWEGYIPTAVLDGEKQSEA